MVDKEPGRRDFSIRLDGPLPSSLNLTLGFEDELRSRVIGAIAARDYTWQQLADIAGYEESAFRRLFRYSASGSILKMREMGLLRLAQLFHLVVVEGKVTRRNSWEVLPAVISLYKSLANRVDFQESWLTYTKCLFTFCVGEPMRVWFNSDSFAQRGLTAVEITDRLRKQKLTNDEMFLRHQEGSILHRILLREEIFTDALKTDPEIVRSAIDALKDLGGSVMLYIGNMHDWMEARIRMAQGCGMADCCSLSVIDGRLVVYRPECGGEHLVSESHEVVRKCTEAIESAMDVVPEYSIKGCIAYFDRMLASRNRKSRPR